MDNIDKSFFIALAYATASGENLDIHSFYQKVIDTEKEVTKLLQKSSKIHTSRKSSLGIR